MNINEIIKAMTEAVEDKNMTVLVIIMIAVMVLFTSNIVLGTIEGTKKESFNLKKFLFGIMKAVVIFFITLWACYGFNLLCIGSKMANFIEFSSDFIAGAQIVGVAAIYGKDLSLEVLDKMKSFRDLKYTSFDDMKVIVPEYSEETLNG